MCCEDNVRNVMNDNDRKNKVSCDVVWKLNRCRFLSSSHKAIAIATRKKKKKKKNDVILASVGEYQS